MTNKRSQPTPPLAVIILAAGLGTRMKSDLPKVLHPVCGRPMLAYVLDAAHDLAPARIVVVTGEDQDEVAALLPQGCERAVQHQRLGTGDAVRTGMEPLAAFVGDVMVLYADVPLVDAAFVHDLLESHRGEACVATLTTVVTDDPAAYGRIVRDDGRPRGAHRRVQGCLARGARAARDQRRRLRLRRRRRCAPPWSACRPTTPRASCI